MKLATQFALKKQLASYYFKTLQNEFSCLKDYIFSSLNVATNLSQIPVKIVRVRALLKCWMKSFENISSGRIVIYTCRQQAASSKQEAVCLRTIILSPSLCFKYHKQHTREKHGQIISPPCRNVQILSLAKLNPSWKETGCKRIILLSVVWRPFFFSLD